MRKQVFIGFITVFTLLAATGCGGEPEQQEQQEQPTVEETQVPVNQPAGAESLEPVVDNNKAGEEFEDYKTVVNSEKSSVNDCNKLENEEYKEKCLAIVYTKLAEDKKDSSQCANITIIELKEECLARVEILKNPNVLPD